MLSLLMAFFAVLLLREKQKKPFVSPTFFATLFLENEEKAKKAKKANGKNTEKCFPIHF